MGAYPLFFKPLTGEIKTMKIFTNHRYALITGIVLALILSWILHRALVPDAQFNHQSLARWVHIVSGIFWIGLLYYLNAVQVPATVWSKQTGAALHGICWPAVVFARERRIQNTLRAKKLRRQLSSLFASGCDVRPVITIETV